MQFGGQKWKNSDPFFVESSPISFLPIAFTLHFHRILLRWLQLSRLILDPPISAKGPFIWFDPADSTIRGYKAKTDYINIILEICKRAKKTISTGVKSDPAFKQIAPADAEQRKVSLQL